MAEDPEDAALVAELVEHAASGFLVYGLTPSRLLCVQNRCGNRARSHMPLGVATELVDHEAAVHRQPNAIAADPAETSGRHAFPPGQCQRFLFAGSAATETTTRDADSPKSVAMSSKAGGTRGHHGGDPRPRQARVEAALRQRHGHAALGAVVRRPDESRRRPRDEHPLQRRLALEIERRRHAANQRRASTFRYSLPPSSARALAEQDDGVARGLERPPHDRVRVLDQTDDAEHRRRQHAPGRRFRCRG